MIQKLTKDEDLRQDLWIAYLMSKSTSAFTGIINNNDKGQDKALNYCWQLCYYDPEDFCKELLWH